MRNLSQDCWLPPRIDRLNTIDRVGAAWSRKAIRVCMERLSAVITACASAVDLRFVVHLYNDRRPETCSNVERIQSLYGLILFVVDKTHSVITAHTRVGAKSIGSSRSRATTRPSLWSPSKTLIPNVHPPPQSKILHHSTACSTSPVVGLEHSRPTTRTVWPRRQSHARRSTSKVGKTRRCDSIIESTRPTSVSPV